MGYGLFSSWEFFGEGINNNHFRAFGQVKNGGSKQQKINQTLEICPGAGDPRGVIQNQARLARVNDYAGEADKVEKDKANGDLRPHRQFRSVLLQKLFFLIWHFLSKISFGMGWLTFLTALKRNMAKGMSITTRQAVIPRIMHRVPSF